MPKKKLKNKKDKTNHKKPKSALKFRVSDQFLKDYKSLPQSIQNDIDSTLKLIKKHKDFTPGMQPGKLTNNIWYLRAGGGTRITFSYLQDNIIFLRRCGGHSLVDKKSKK